MSIYVERTETLLKDGKALISELKVLRSSSYETKKLVHGWKNRCDELLSGTAWEEKAYAIKFYPPYYVEPLKSACVERDYFFEAVKARVLLLEDYLDFLLEEEQKKTVLNTTADAIIYIPKELEVKINSFGISLDDQTFPTELSLAMYKGKLLFVGVNSMYRENA